MNRGLWAEILPPIALRPLRRLAAAARFARYARKDALQANAQLKGQGRGRRAFLLATGPSLKLEDLTSLAGEDCFSLSNFFLHADLQVVKPKYHFFAPYHEPLILENYLEWLREADRVLPAETGIVLGHSGLPLVEEHKLFPDRQIHYLYLSERASVNSVDLLRPVPAPKTGTLMMLPVLIYMGYTEICLLGCDHTVLRDYGRKVENFYEGRLDLRKNATNGDCWDDIVSSHAHSMAVFEQYGLYKEILDAQGVVVRNLSKDSWLDCFPAADLKEVCRR